MTQARATRPRSGRRAPGHWLLACGLALLLAGCAGRTASAPSPPLSALAATAPQTQRLTFDYQDQRQQLLGVLRHDGETLRLALLSPQGQRLLTLVHDARGARFLADAQVEPPFPADWLATRLTWSLWPAQALSEAFHGSDWRLAVSNGTRSIYRRDRLIARIAGNGECRIIDDLEGGYRLAISPANAINDRKQEACPAN